ncbi:MAG: DUF4012 domain-containing protein [Dehalococcoidia bacterium]|nr:DUF4012 domain-containing protein [Dehalococcoidia bacterium]
MKTVLLLIFILLLASSAFTVFFGLSSKSHLESGIKAVEEGISAFAANESLSLNEGSIAKAQSSFARAENDFMYVRSVVAPIRLILPLMRWIPRYGEEIAAAPDLVDIAAFGAQAGSYILQGVAPAFDAVSGTQTSGGGAQGNFPRLLAALSEAKDNFARAAAALEKVEKSRQSLKKYSISDPRILKAINALDKYLPTLKAATEGTLLTPDLFGYQGQKRYLVLFQNNNELRATGGFIGGAALATLQNGAIAEFTFRDSYDFDSAEPRPFVTPPEPLVKYMLFQDWTLRDSNWWPDFPTSARKAMEFLESDFGQQVDGVIAIDQNVVVELLGYLGPVIVPDFKETVTQANFLALADTYAHPPGYKAFDDFADLRKVITNDNRKAFLGSVGEELIKRLNSANKDLLIKLAPSLMDIIKEKHVMLYVNESESAQMLSSTGWDGSVAAGEGDYLMVIDSNVGYSKADKYVNRSINYDVVIDSTSTPVESTLKLRYTNTSNETPPFCSAQEIDFWASHDSCYKDYVRVYVPKGTVFLGATGLDSPIELYTENDRLVMAGLLVMGSGKEREVTFSYVPPRSAVSYSNETKYRLTVQKQAGTDAIPFSLRISLPDSLVPSMVSQGGSIQPAALETTLKTDLRYSLPLKAKAKERF